MDTKMNIKKTSCLEFFKTDYKAIQIGKITWSSEIINPLSDPVDYQMAKFLGSNGAIKFRNFFTKIFK